MGAVEKSGSGILNRLGFSDGGYVEAKEERVAIVEFGFDGMDEGSQQRPGISWYEKLADVEMADTEDVAQMEQ
ncbi:unnamed protein product [Lampetra fluviatilis]